MRVLSIIETLGRGGGAERAMAELAFGLVEHEHRIWHFSRSNRKPVDRNLIERIRAHGIPVSDVPWQTVALRELREATLAAFEPHVVLIHWWRNEPWLPWLAEMRDQPGRPAFVITLHSARLSVSRGYDRYVAVARFQRDRLKHLAGEPFAIIPNAVDLGRYSAPSRASRSYPSERLVVGSLSGLRPEKVPPDLMRRVIAWSVPAVEWRFAGDGAYRAQFEEEVAAGAEPGTFLFLGHIAHRFVPRFLADIDVLCHVVSNETLDCNPIGVIEALAAGVPVVAEARGGLLELVEHGYNGLLADTPDQVGELLARLARDRQLVRSLAAGARASSRRFGRQMHIAAYRALLAEVAPQVSAGVA